MPRCFPGLTASRSAVSGLDPALSLTKTRCNSCPYLWLSWSSPRSGSGLKLLIHPVPTTPGVPEPRCAQSGSPLPPATLPSAAPEHPAPSRCQTKARLVKHLQLAQAGHSTGLSALQRQPGMLPLARAWSRGKVGKKKKVIESTGKIFSRRYPRNLSSRKALDEPHSSLQ